MGKYFDDDPDRIWSHEELIRNVVAAGQRILEQERKERPVYYKDFMSMKLFTQFIDGIRSEMSESVSIKTERDDDIDLVCASLSGEEIVFFNPDLFLSISEFATCVDLCPKTNGKIEIGIDLYAKKPLKKRANILRKDIVVELGETFNKAIVELDSPDRVMSEDLLVDFACACDLIDLLIADFEGFVDDISTDDQTGDIEIAILAPYSTISDMGHPIFYLARRAKRISFSTANEDEIEIRLVINGIWEE